MQLGFVSAILPELELEDVLRFAAESGFECIEAMCWPAGKAERRYAGVTHIDVNDCNDEEARRINALCDKYGVKLSALGYYPNPLCADENEASVYIAHIMKVISAAAKLGIGKMNTFVGREYTRSLRDNWAMFDERWPKIVRHADAEGVKIGIENCPMLFSLDEWPGGKNMAISPAIWREMFARIPSENFGLNYDPSHLVWQMMDEVAPIYEFAPRFSHVHAKDLKILRHKLNDCGILDFGWNVPKLPGLGDVRWSEFFAALTEMRYDGPVVIEVEDRAYEGSLEERKKALIQSKRFLENFTI